MDHTSTNLKTGKCIYKPKTNTALSAHRKNSKHKINFVAVEMFHKKTYR